MDIGVLLSTSLITTHELIRICNACNMAFVEMARDWSMNPPRISSFSMIRSTIKYYVSLEETDVDLIEEAKQNMNVRKINVHRLMKLGMQTMEGKEIKEKELRVREVSIAAMIFQELARLYMDPEGNDWWKISTGAIAVDPCGLRISCARNYDVDGTTVQLCHWIKPGELENAVGDCWGSGIFKTAGNVVGLLVAESTPDWYRQLRCRDVILATHGADLEDDMPPFEFDMPMKSARVMQKIDSCRMTRSKAVSNLARSAISDLDEVERSIDSLVKEEHKNKNESHKNNELHNNESIEAVEPVIGESHKNNSAFNNSSIKKVHIPPPGVHKLRIPTSDSDPKRKPISPSTRLELLETLTQSQRANENVEKVEKVETDNKYEREALMKIMEFLELMANSPNSSGAATGLVLGHLLLEIKVAWK